MTTLRLDRPRALETLAGLPVRCRLTSSALRVLVDAAGASWPWPDPPAPDGREGADLVRLGLLAPGSQPQPGVRQALAALLAPEVRVEIEVSVRGDGAPGGWVQLSARQGLREGRVCGVASVGGELELGWWAQDHWHTELARTVVVAPPRDPPPPPVSRLDVPLDELLATGEALRTGRDDVLAELVDRALPCSSTPAGPLSRADLLVQLVRLHRGTVGRLRLTVVQGVPGGGGGHRRAGWLSWLMMADGWRSLTPLVADGRPLVRIAPVGPLDLGRRVAGLVTSVRGRP